jgi:hypothetical protein
MEALDGVLDRPIVGSIQICVTEGRHIVAGGKCLGYRGAKLATGSNDDDAHYFPPRRRSTESGAAMVNCIIEAILPRADPGFTGSRTPDLIDGFVSPQRASRVRLRGA